VLENRHEAPFRRVIVFRCVQNCKNKLEEGWE
jgi:hypothetical protein